MSALRTPLYALHAEFGARFTAFAGYDMPLQYREGLRAEHLWTREHAGLFDVSHMGQLRVRGTDTEAALERALPVDFDGWPIGRQRYSLLLNDAGGIVDDLMLTRLDGEVAIVVNASRREADLAGLRARCPQLSIDWHPAALIALQGPQAEEALATLSAQVTSLAFMQVAEIELDGARCLVSRSGYTGEDGYEISVPEDAAERLARALLAHPEVKPVGLGARDTLRLEAGLHLYGQDMDERTTVCEADLAWAIARSRRAGGAKAGGYAGSVVTLREAKDGVARRLCALIGVESVPVRSGAALCDAAGTQVGMVTSGTVSPSTGRPIMFGYVSTVHAPDSPLFAEVRGRMHRVELTARPFVPKRYKR